MSYQLASLYYFVSYLQSMSGQALFHPNVRNVWAYLSYHGASDWHFKLTWSNMSVCFLLSLSILSRKSERRRTCRRLTADKGRHVLLLWADRDGILNFGASAMTYHAAISAMYLWCNWSPVTGCNVDKWCTIPYNALQFRIDSLCIFVPDPSLDLLMPLSRWANLLFRGFAANVPQNLPQQSQCAVRWVSLSSCDDPVASKMNIHWMSFNWKADMLPQVRCIPLMVALRTGPAVSTGKKTSDCRRGPSFCFPNIQYHYIA